MGLIFWIDQNTFRSSLIERVFKKKQLPFYTLSSLEDFSYLVDDLGPVLVVLDGQTYQQNPEAFRKQYEASQKMQNIPFILLEPKGEMGFIKKKVGELRTPVEPFELPELLSKIFTAN